MNDKVTYHQQVSYCGKPRCKRCREGVGHGPYWYAYQTVDGRTTRTYIGKHLPADKEAERLGNQPAAAAQAAEKDQTMIRIYTLGQFRLERRDPRDSRDWQTVTDSAWKQQRVRALLGCLVSVGGRKLGREQLMDALWPELDADIAGGRLDRAVYSLRQVFEPGRNRLATSPLLLTEREILSLADSSKIWVDADVFEQLITKAHEAKDELDPGTKENLLKEAANLYGEEFLPEDQRNEWTRLRRESLQRSWIGLLLELADLMINRDALTLAIEPLDKLISVDPANEAGVQRLMIVLEKLGRRGEALRAYKKLAGVLQKEYGITPLPDTRKLYEDLFRGNNKETPANDSSVVDDKVRDLANPTLAVNDAPAVQIGRTHQSPLVGRQQELNQLRDLITATEQTARFRLGSQRRSTVASLDPNRRAQCVLLMGDVGIGKTRLAEELGRDAKKKGWAVAWSRVYAQEGNIPYRLWTEVLRKAMDQGVWQRQEVKRRPLVFQPLGTLLPEIHDLLSTVNFPSSLSPEQEQLRLWEAARELLTLISESTPLLIALDDLQWADSSSCELLAYLARRTYGYPIVIVGTCRENELEHNSPLKPLLTDLRRENAVETISLELLSSDHITSLVSQVSHAPEPMIEKITNRAAGNPFFAEELARSVVENLPSLEALAKSGNDILPDTINAVLALRMARLSERCQQLLGKAAVLGGSFEFQVISEMEARGNIQDSEDLVLELLEEALNSGMLTEEGTGTRITYHFWHPLLSTYLYDRSSAARRASQHRKAAEVLRKMYKNREAKEAATITYHLVKGGADNELIVEYAELAGNYAYGISSYPEAEKNFTLALKYLESSFNHSVHSTAENKHLIRLLGVLGECMSIQGKPNEARQLYERILAINSLEMESYSSDQYSYETQFNTLIWVEIGKAWYNIGDTSKAQNCYSQGEQMLIDADILDGTALAYLRYQQSHIKLREGAYQEAYKLAQEALQLFEGNVNLQRDITQHEAHSNRISRTIAGDPVDLGRIYILLSNIEIATGRYAEALEHLKKALAISERYNCVREVAIISCNMGDLYLRISEHSQAQVALRKSLSFAERMGEFPLIAFVLGNQGMLYTRMGNLEEAENEFKKAISTVESLQDPLSMSWWYTCLSGSLQAQDKLSDAKSALLYSMKLVRSKHITPCLGLALVTLGELRLCQAQSMSLDGGSPLSERDRLLQRAQRTLQHALLQRSLESETNIEGHIALSQVFLLLGDLGQSYQLANQALIEAKKSESIWLIVKAQYMLGDIFATKQQIDLAEQYYEQALTSVHKNDMRLEYGRILRQYGFLLLQEKDKNGSRHKKGLAYIEEANRIFEAANAIIDLKIYKNEIFKFSLVNR
ncbi:hypothetical protein KDW_37150 [Dictyobacter vulcani]|uniref:Bacterial transcriptional activator domain-containing protein n=1 Tax=Dictyobacter vulcani TaxID=2607529 RepID=A0A5J4KPM3_9CHLR|nr:DUF6788 family protein [Dictyobacter vulcani]GER89553.1 hypothetical protein KDW_37150 [Dictyobacter vulcani]